MVAHIPVTLGNRCVQPKAVFQGIDGRESLMAADAQLFPGRNQHPWLSTALCEAAVFLFRPESGKTGRAGFVARATDPVRIGGV